MDEKVGNLNVKPTLDLIRRIDDWRAGQQQVIGRIMPRAEAGRVLIERALGTLEGHKEQNH